jgi:plastocyanin
MSKKRALFLILFGLELAVLIPLGIAILPKAAVTRHISVDAKRFGYTPARIIVNKGDTVRLRFSTSDVTHGFHLDGYPIELIARKGLSFQKNFGQEDRSHLKTDWNRVSSVKFVAYRSGKFVFRCTETCGNLHPFMTGELYDRRADRQTQHALPFFHFPIHMDGLYDIRMGSVQRHSRLWQF